MVRINMPGPLPVVWLNDGLCALEDAKIPVLDRGFLFGDGVYELIPFYTGVPLRLDHHLERLARSLRETRIANPYNRAGWQTLIETVIAANDATDISLYIQVTRGAPAHRDHAFPGDIAPTVFAMCARLPVLDRSLLDDGVAAILREDTRWSRRDIKATSLLANVLLRQEAVEAGAAEVILHDGAHITEGSASSVFAVIDGVILTPPDGPEILPGTTRDLALELAQAADLPAEFSPLTVGQFKAADEIWICSSIREVLAVTQLDDVPVGNGRPGPVWRSVYDLFQQYKKSIVEQDA